MDLLETVEIETGPAPRFSVLWLHGLGADGHDCLLYTSDAADERSSVDLGGRRIIQKKRKKKKKKTPDSPQTNTTLYAVNVDSTSLVRCHDAAYTTGTT